MAKYFIYGYYGFNNFGDDLLLEVMVNRIKQNDQDAEFVIRARAPVPALVTDKRVQFLLIEPILEHQSQSRLVRFLKYRAALMEQVRCCDVMVIGGGTLFIDKGRINWSLLFIHEAVRAAKRAGRKVVVVGVAIDILSHPLSVWLTQRIFAMADFAAVRDSLSMAYFQAVTVPPKLAADLAWLKGSPQTIHLTRTRRVIGLNFIDYFRSTTQSKESHQAYRLSLRRLIERHSQTCDFQLIALQKGIGQRDDWFFEEFQEFVPNSQMVYIDSDKSLCLALDGLDAVVTTRFHLALLAARAGLPTCIVDHELKLTSLAQDLVLPSVSMVEFAMYERPDIMDPIDRLDTWDPAITGRRADRMTDLAEVNFAWMES